MGKKYLNTKEGSIEQSVLDVWQEAAEMRAEGMDGRTKEYRSHRARLEANRVRRENKRKALKAEQPETLNGAGEHSFEVGTNRYAEYTQKVTPGQMKEEIAELDALIEELEEGILGNVAKAAGKTVAKAATSVAKKGWEKASGSKIGKAIGKVKSGIKKTKEIAGKIKTSAKTGTAYGDEYDPMIEKLEIIESKLNEYCRILEEEFEEELNEKLSYNYGTNQRLMAEQLAHVRMWQEAASSAVDPKDREELDDGGEATGEGGKKTAQKMKKAKEPAPNVSEDRGYAGELERTKLHGLEFYAVTFQKGRGVGTRDFRTIYVQAKNEDDAIKKAEAGKGHGSKIERGYKFSSIRKEELELDEKSAKYLEIEFKDSTTAVNAYSYINNKIEPGGRQPWDDFNQEGSSIQFDNMKDADSLMKELGKKFKFKVYEREEVELDEGKKETWMGRAQDAVKKAGGHPGKIDWNTATHLYNTGKSPEEAGERLAKLQKEELELDEEWTIEMPPAEGGKTVTNVDSAKIMSFIKSKGGSNRDMQSIKKGKSVTFQGKTGAFYKIIKEEADLDEAFKEGDIVIAKIGPHKGAKHEIIHVNNDGTYNMKPLGIEAKRIAYRLGAIKAKEKDIMKEKVELDEKVKVVDPKTAKMIAKIITSHKLDYNFEYGLSRNDIADIKKQGGTPPRGVGPEGGGSLYGLLAGLGDRDNKIYLDGPDLVDGEKTIGKWKGMTIGDMFKKARIRTEEFELKEASGDKEAYEKFFNAALKKFKVDSPADFKSDEEKKKFFDYIDKGWEGDNEKAEQVREFKIQSMKAALAQVWGVKEGKNPFKTEDDKKKDDETTTGKKAAKIDINPDITVSKNH